MAALTFLFAGHTKHLEVCWWKHRESCKLTGAIHRKCDALNSSSDWSNSFNAIQRSFIDITNIDTRAVHHKAGYFLTKHFNLRWLITKNITVDVMKQMWP